jgi:transposase
VLEKFQERNITNAILVMDNVPFHKCKETQERIATEGHTLLFLPPFLNENMFSQWKG